MNTFKQVIGSLGDLGAEVLKESVNVPGGIVGGVLESGKAGKKQSQEKLRHGALREIEKSNNREINSQNARRLLQQFVGSSEPARKEPTVYEKKIMEEENKKKIFDEQKKREEHALKRMSSKPRQGQQKYGIHEKITEASKNVKAE